ncbi:hypothetical protein GOODEAATRI_004802 [Goodea atripinnis]|uniref:Fibrinogen C-terminal domain-containing protein n=1 Tax=Goodea atripinnis TaxID=208336 RepID=A0ABV0P1U0_9TELE
MTLATALIFSLIICMTTQKAGGQIVGANGEYKKSSRSSDLKAGRCSYTFIVPQQKITGALCVNTHSPIPNQSEVAALKLELKRQQEQLEKLQRQLEHEGSLATEVRALHKESNSMNSRIAHLYAQLLHEVIHKKDLAVEHQRFESLLLNVTAQVRIKMLRNHHLIIGETTSGIYLLRLQSANRLLQAWCEQSQAQGGWTVIQRRQDGSVNFFMTWEQYKVTSSNLKYEKHTEDEKCCSVEQAVDM